MGLRFVFTGKTKLSNKIAQNFRMSSANKNDFNQLLISYLVGFTSYDTSAVNVYAEMINTSVFYDAGKNHFISWKHLLDAISFLASTGKDSVKRGTCRWAMNTKILTLII